MGLAEQNVEVYECPSCGRLGRQRDATCCGETREAVDATVRYEPPEMESVVKEIFDISSTELDVCSAVRAEGDATIDDLTARLSLNRSTITRYLNHLVDLGVVEKNSQKLAEGGRANVYSPAPLDDIHRTFQLGLYTWLDDVEDVFDELHQERLKQMIEKEDAEMIDGSDSHADGNENDSLINRLLPR